MRVIGTENTGLWARAVAGLPIIKLAVKQKVEDPLYEQVVRQVMTLTIAATQEERARLVVELRGRRPA
jgi:hypothetical protein